MSDKPDITSSVSDCAMVPKIFEDKVDPDAPDESEESVIKFGIQDPSKSSASPPQSSIRALGVEKRGWGATRGMGQVEKQCGSSELSVRTAV